MTGTPAPPAEHPATPAVAAAEGGAGPRSLTDPWRGWVPTLPGVLVGLVSALVGLDRRALWLDEAYTLGALHQLGPTLRDTSGTMGLYYVLLRAWTVPSESVAWLRGLSVLLGLATVVVVVRLAARLLDRTSAAVAGVVLALSPMWFAYAREARSYALVMLLVAVSWLADDHGSADLATGARRRWWYLHTAVAVVLPLAHGLTVLQLLPQVAVVLLGPPSRTARVGVLRGVAAASATTGLLLALGAGSVGDWVSPLGGEQAGFLVERFTSTAWLPLAVVLSAVVLAGAAVAGRAALRAPDEVVRARALVPLAWGLAPIVLLAALSVVRPSFIPRYAVGSAPGIALLVVVALRAAGRRHRVLGGAAFVAVVAVLLVGRVDAGRASEDGWRMAARVVADRAEPGDTVLLGTEPTTRPAFEAAWRDVDPGAPVALVPSDRPLGRVRRFEPDATPTDDRWAEARAADRLWVVGDRRRLELDRLPWLVDGWAGRPATHREVARWDGPDAGVVVVLLEPLGG